MKAETRTTSSTAQSRRCCAAKKRYANTTAGIGSRGILRPYGIGFPGLALFFAVLLQFIWGVPVRAADLGLISPGTLHASFDKWAILDGRPEKVWKRQHIPGAVSFSWEDYTQTDEKKIPYRVFSPEKLAAVFGAMGIDENTPVVAYGDADTSWGGEGWICWVLAWMGHKGPVRLLSGGIAAWEGAGYPVEATSQTLAKPIRSYEVDVNPEVSISAKELAKAKNSTAIVDTRSTREWIFEAHVPGAVHIHWKDFLTGKHSKVITKAQFAALLTEKGIRPDQPVVYYCTGGVRSAYAWLVHRLQSDSPAVNFEGGMVAWEKIKHLN